MNLPPPPQEKELIASELEVVIKSRATLCPLALVLLAEAWPIVSQGGSLFWQVRLGLLLLLVCSLFYQIRILASIREKRRKRRWVNWQVQRHQLFKKRGNAILMSNSNSEAKESVSELLSLRKNLLYILEDGYPILEEEELNYQMDFDQLAMLALEGLADTGDRKPVSQVIEFGKQLEKEIPLALTETWKPSSFDKDDFNRRLENVRHEHGVRVGVSRRGLEEGRIETSSQ